MKNMEMKKGFKKTEIGVIPEEWEVKKLGNVGEVKMCRRVFSHQTKPNGTIPFYKIGTFGKEADAYISEDLYNEYRQKFSFPKREDILISAAGTIGRTIIYNGEPAYFQDSNIVWIDNNGALISNEFLYHVFQIVKYNTEGGTIQRLYNSILKNTKFSCPPIAEQTAIATVLSDMDALLTQTDRLIQKKKAIKQGLMQELLKPKEGWVKIKLGDAIKVSRGGSPRPIQNYLTSDPNGINWIKIGDTSVTSKYITSSNEKIIAEGVLNSRQVFVGDFLLSNSMSFGRPYILKIDGCVHDGWLVLQDYQTIFNREFLYYFLSSSYVLNQYKNLAAGSSVLNLNKDIVEKIFLQKPASIDEQIEIANILSTIDEEITLLESKLSKLHAQKQGMMQVLLTGKIRLK
jgi:type I restriction enzyme, S subunit